jgi:hypothetical protein
MRHLVAQSFFYDADAFAKQFLDEKIEPYDSAPIDLDLWAARKFASGPDNGWGGEADRLGYG